MDGELSDMGWDQDRRGFAENGAGGPTFLTAESPWNGTVRCQTMSLRF
jgi:hypothetical protein